MALSKITAASITSNVISSALIANGEITFADIANNTITGALIASATLTGDKLGLTSITNNLIAIGAVTGDKLASTLTSGNVNLSGATSFLSTALESANVTTAMGSVTIINIASPLVVFTSNSSANSAVNFTGLAGMPVGNTASFVIINPNGSTAYYLNTYQVDATPTTVKWAGGAPFGGTSANTDIYSFSIIKTSATPTYNVFASVQSFF